MTATVLIITGLVASCFSLIIAGLSRHQKSAGRQLELMGAIGAIEIALDPEGAVIVNGELWRARFTEGRGIKGEINVRVVGARGHLLLVEPEYDNAHISSTIQNEEPQLS